MALQGPQTPISLWPVETTHQATTTQATTTRLGPSIQVVSLTVQSRIAGTRSDLVTIVLRLRNDGGPGTAIVQIIQLLGVSKYKVLEKAYVVLANAEQSFTETFVASPEAYAFEAVIVQQIPA